MLGIAGAFPVGTIISFIRGCGGLSVKIFPETVILILYKSFTMERFVLIHIHSYFASSTRHSLGRFYAFR